MTVDAAGFPPYQLRYIGVFLLRHDRGAGAETIRQVHKIKLGRGPQHQLFREAGQVSHGQGRGGTEFDGKITVADAVQGVLADAFKAQQLGSDGAVDGVGGAC